MLGRKRDISAAGLIMSDLQSTTKVQMNEFRDRYHSHESTSPKSCASGIDSGETSGGEVDIHSPASDLGENEPNAFHQSVYATACDMDSVTCFLCANVIYNPIALPCGHIYCLSCLSHHLEHNKYYDRHDGGAPKCLVCLEDIVLESCSSCGIDIASPSAVEDKHLTATVQRKVSSMFPFYETLRRKMGYVSEKRVYYELSGMRSRAMKLRQLFIRERSEKAARVQMVSKNFMHFLDCCRRESKLNKQYEKELAALQAMEIEIEGRMREGGSFADTCSEGFDRKCCLDSTADRLKEIVDSGAASYHTFTQSPLSSCVVFRCTSCSKLLVM